MTTSTIGTDPARRRKTLLISGGFCLFFSIYLLIFLLPDFIRSLAGPEPMTLSQAAERATDENLYVLLADGSWECETIDYVIGYSSTSADRVDTKFTEIFVTNPSGAVVVLAQMSGELECADFDGREIVGYLTRMTADQQQDLTNEVRLARFINGETYLELCGFCGQTNSLIGTLFGLAFFMGGLALLILGLRTVVPAEGETL